MGRGSGLRVVLTVGEEDDAKECFAEIETLFEEAGCGRGHHAPDGVHQSTEE